MKTISHSIFFLFIIFIFNWTVHWYYPQSCLDKISSWKLKDYSQIYSNNNICGNVIIWKVTEDVKVNKNGLIYFSTENNNFFRFDNEIKTLPINNNIFNTFQSNSNTSNITPLIKNWDVVIFNSHIIKSTDTIKKKLNKRINFLNQKGQAHMRLNWVTKKTRPRT